MCELVRDEAIQYVTFTGKHGKRWEPLNKKRGKTWYEAGPFACWLQPPCYEVVIRESLDVGCAGEVVTEGVCDDL